MNTYVFSSECNSNSKADFIFLKSLYCFCLKFELLKLLSSGDINKRIEHNTKYKCEIMVQKRKTMTFAA